MTKTLPKKTSKKPARKTKESVAEIAPSTQLQVAHHFPCPIYLIERPDFLEAVNAVSEENLEVSRKDRDLDEIYPVYMTGNFYGDPRMAEFTQFVGATAWNILNEQGYVKGSTVPEYESPYAYLLGSTVPEYESSNAYLKNPNVIKYFNDLQEKYGITITSPRTGENPTTYREL